MKRIIPIAAVALLAMAGPAQAAHERSDPAERLVDTSRRIEDATQRLYERVAFRAEHGQRRARRVLPALRRLDQRAEHFVARADRDVAHPRQLRRRHARLVQAVRFSEACAQELGMHKLRRELLRIAGMVDRLDRQIEQVRIARFDARSPRHAWRGAHRDEVRGGTYEPWRSGRLAYRWR